VALLRTRKMENEHIRLIMPYTRVVKFGLKKVERNVDKLKGRRFVTKETSYRIISAIGKLPNNQAISCSRQDADAKQHTEKAAYSYPLQLTLDDHAMPLEDYLLLHLCRAHRSSKQKAVRRKDRFAIRVNRRPSCFIYIPCALGFRIGGA
jgi:hypothetical protein